MKIFYTVPAKKLKKKPSTPMHPKGTSKWEQSILPLGNGTIGLSAFGDVQTEKIVLNCKTLWTGGPSPKRPHYVGGNLQKADVSGKTPADYFKEIRALFADGRSAEADKLCDKLVGEKDGYGAYQCFGTLRLHFQNGFLNGVSQYKRTLDLETGILDIETAFRSGKTQARQYFVSYPDKVAVLHLSENKPSLSFTLSYTADRNTDNLASTADGFTVQGALEDNGLLYCGDFKVETDGKLSVLSHGKVCVHNASYANIYLSLDTNYADNYPVYRTGETLEALTTRVGENVRRAKEKGYAALCSAHKADVSALMQRSQISLGGKENDMPTDKLLKAYQKGTLEQAQKRSLEELLYQYGKYLTVASSRETDVLPSNLQGIWNCTNQPIWASDFHLNINLQMNYWPTYMTNLVPCAKPLLRYVEALCAPGRVTAEAYTGVASSAGETNGFLFHTQNTPFGWTCPGWEFSWGWSPVAVAWILHSVYEYYEYTKDATLLQNEIYPMLKESADYFESLLMQKGDRLVFCPSFSPEHGPRTMGNTYENTLLWQLFKDTADAETALQLEETQIAHHRSLQEKLQPVEIGASGQIKEWYEEAELGKMGEKHHRHLSHLLGLYPCSLFQKFEHPDWNAAAKVSLCNRGDKSTGWAMGQRICAWARLGDGNRALSLIETLFQNGIYVNLLDFHPPFQIDGNFGYTAGVTEMLLQSHLDCIELLPALPTDWKEGFASGLLARGAFELSFSWAHHRLKALSVTANAGGTCCLYYAGAQLSVQGVESHYDELSRLCFQTEAGKTYTIELAN